MLVTNNRGKGCQSGIRSCCPKVTPLNSRATTATPKIWIQNLRIQGQTWLLNNVTFHRSRMLDSNSRYRCYMCKRAHNKCRQHKSWNKRAGRCRKSK